MKSNKKAVVPEDKETLDRLICLQTYGINVILDLKFDMTS